MAYRYSNVRFNDGAGRDEVRREPISIWWAVVAAAEETLQSGSLAGSWVKLFENHLSNSQWLRWREDLAGSGEMRRAYSALYGRFFARGLLRGKLGISRFVSLRRNETRVSNMPFPVSVHRRQKGDIPDWIAWNDSAGQLALCEAKGNLSAIDFLLPGTPKCIGPAKKQFGRVVVRGANRFVGAQRWVVANRWSTEIRDVEPASLLWDPPTGSSLKEEEIADFREAMTNGWLDQICHGFGWETGENLVAEGIRSLPVRVRAQRGPLPAEGRWLSDNGEGDEGGDDERKKLQGHIFNEELTTVKSRSLLTDLNGHLIPYLDENPEMLPELAMPRHEKKEYEGDFIITLATRFGLRPILNKREFNSIKKDQELARKFDQPALLLALPKGFSARKKIGAPIWEDDGGIAYENDLSVFDLRTAEIDLV